MSSRIGWAVFVILGLACIRSALSVQLVYAGLSILVLGLPHGASDLLSVPARRRNTFLIAYVICIAVLLIWWKTAPFTALFTFLLLSSIHFGHDDAPASRPIERVSRGILMVAGPALLHRTALTGIFVAVTGDQARAADLATGLAALAIAASALMPLVVADYQRRGDFHGAAIITGGVLALLVLPPLIGFAIGFVLMHARAQLQRRMTMLGCPNLRCYLRATAPVLAGAIVLSAAVAWLFASGATPSTPILFAAIAALAIPHMLVTPLWADPDPIVSSIAACRRTA